MMDLDSQVALVTGASRGIGRSIALALGGRGATVVGTGQLRPPFLEVLETTITGGVSAGKSTPVRPLK